MFFWLAMWLGLQSYDEALQSGVAAYESGRLEEAESFLRQAIRIAPGEAAPRLLLGQLAIASARPELALEIIAPLPLDEPVARCLRGRAFFELEQFRDAARELDAAVKELGNDRLCRESLALAQMEIGDYTRAIDALEPLVEGTSANDRSPALNATYGIALALSGRHEEAVTALEAALDEEPRRARALFYLGRSLQLLERTAEAADVYGRGLDFPPPENIRFSLGLARCQISLGRVNEARKGLDDLVTRHPRVARAWLLRGVVLFEEGDYEGSAKDIRRAIELGYTLAESDLRLGMALGMLGDYKGARDALAAALAKEPDLAVAYYYEGLFLFRQGEAIALSSGQMNPFGLQALRLLERSNTLLPNPRTSLAMAEAYLRLGQHLRALDAASTATQVPELAPDARHIKALAHHELLEYAPAEEAYRDAFAAGANSAEIYHDFGNLLSVMGRWEEARVALERALELDPSSSGTHLELGIALQNLGASREALEHLNHAVSLTPLSPDAWYQKGLSESRAGDTEDAIRSWRRALELSPSDSRLMYRLATELLKLGRMDERAALLAEFQQRQREHEAREQRDERLDNLLRAALKAVDDADEATAMALFNDAWTLAPDDARPYLYLADLHASRGRRREATRTLEDGIARLPDNLALREMLRSLESGR